MGEKGREEMRCGRGGRRNIHIIHLDVNTTGILMSLLLLITAAHYYNDYITMT